MKTIQESRTRLSDLVVRIRGEFREMPGLRLTFAQACRLWQLDPATCRSVIETLLGEQFLSQTADGQFVALPSPRAVRFAPIKALDVRGRLEDVWDERALVRCASGF